MLPSRRHTLYLQKIVHRIAHRDYLGSLPPRTEGRPGNEPRCLCGRNRVDIPDSRGVGSLILKRNAYIGRRKIEFCRCKMAISQRCRPDQFVSADKSPMKNTGGNWRQERAQRRRPVRDDRRKRFELQFQPQHGSLLVAPILA